MEREGERDTTPTPLLWGTQKPDYSATIWR